MFEVLKNWKNNEFTPKFYTFTPNWLISQQAIHSFFINFPDFSRVFPFTRGDFFYACKSIWMRNIVFLPVDLIKEADENGWLRTLAYFVRLKSLYKNNTHYNFSLRRLSERVKCSPTCLSIHMKIMCEHGLIAYHGRNVTFVGLNKLHARYPKRHRAIGVPVDHKNQYDIIRAQIIRFNLSAQDYNIRKSGRQNQRFGNAPNNYREKAQSCYVGLSALGVGYLFGLTAASGSRIRKKLAKLKLLKLQKVFSVLYEDTTLGYYNYLRSSRQIPVYARYVAGKILVERRNRVEYIGAES